MYAQSVRWSILKFWCNPRITALDFLRGQNRTSVLKCRTRAAFRGVRLLLRRITGKLFVCLRADYPHVKHRKCREQSWVVGCWSLAKSTGSGIDTDPALDIVRIDRRKVPLRTLSERDSG